MLILSRNQGERIVIEYPDGEKVIIEFQKVRPSSLIIGTEAPDEISVLRHELVARNSRRKAK